MSNAYRNNHYVPIWYQKRFLVPGTNELLYRDLKPDTFVDPRGVAHKTREIRRLGFKKGFAQEDLYTQFFGAQPRTDIEEQFFGEIDRHGQAAVDYFARFAHPWDGTQLFEELILYMSTQKLRTPKGLGWLQNFAAGRGSVLNVMVEQRSLFCAIWTECVWLIASAEQSETKFIVSDHPITVYNRRFGPRSSSCRGLEDPDIRLHATHTIFPLSHDKVLILTNRSWMQNPYQKENGIRPNPQMMRNALFHLLDIQTLRMLTETEVREINFIIKSRALRYIAAAKEDWLYPERFVTKADWHDFGQGYLLMPDPRSAHYGGETIMMFTGGRSVAVDEYGRHPGQSGYSGDRRSPGPDWNSYQRFQGEFSRLFGPERRGRACTGTRLDGPRLSDDYFQALLNGEERHRRLMSGQRT
jgi:hypothetical protein